MISASSVGSSSPSALPRASTGPGHDLGSGGAASRDNAPLGSVPPGIAGDAVKPSDAAPPDAGEQSAGDLSSRIADLINQQIVSGHLTADQAKELTHLFSVGTPSTSPPSLAPAATDPENAPGSQPGSNDKADAQPLVSRFIKKLQDGQLQGYNQAGSRTATPSALLVRIKI